MVYRLRSADHSTDFMSEVKYADTLRRRLYSSAIMVAKLVLQKSINNDKVRMQTGITQWNDPDRNCTIANNRNTTSAERHVHFGLFTDHKFL